VNDDERTTNLPDPADKDSAEGERPEGIPQEDRGQGPHEDPADKTQPAEGGEQEASQ